MEVELSERRIEEIYKIQKITKCYACKRTIAVFEDEKEGYYYCNECVDEGYIIHYPAIVGTLLSELLEVNPPRLEGLDTCSTRIFLKNYILELMRALTIAKQLYSYLS